MCVFILAKNKNDQEIYPKILIDMVYGHGADLSYRVFL